MNLSAILLLSLTFVTAIIGCKKEKEPDIVGDFVIAREVRFSIIDSVNGQNLVGPGLRYRQDSVRIRYLSFDTVSFHRIYWDSSVTGPKFRESYVNTMAPNEEAYLGYRFTVPYHLRFNSQDTDTVFIEKSTERDVHFYHNGHLVKTLDAMDKTMLDLPLKK